MAAQGHTHLIVAGEAKIIPLVTGLLPGRLRSKLVDTVSAGAGTSTEELVAATLASFVQQEEQESQLYVDRLQQYVMKDGLGAVGVQASLETLQRRQVDVWFCPKPTISGMGGVVKAVPKSFSSPTGHTVAWTAETEGFVR